MTTTNNIAKSTFDEIVALWAWRQASNIADGHNIGVLADELAKALPTYNARDAATSIRKAIIATLRTMSGTDGDQGHCLIDGQDCYWITTNAYDEWHTDQPEWWDAQ